MVAPLVRKTAKELAGAFYNNQDVISPGAYQRTQRFRADAPNERSFVASQWAHFVPIAREILAKMLNDPNRAQAEKDEIFDALLSDRGFATDAQIAKTYDAIMSYH